MKDIIKILKKKLLQVSVSNDEHRIRVIIDRMESLVKTSSKKNIKIKKWDYDSPNFTENKENWAFCPDTQTIYYPIEGDFAVTKLRDEHIISILLHEISHSKFTTVPQEINFPDPKYVFVQMINAFEDVRVEKKLMLEYPGTYDSFKNFSDIMEKVVSEEEWKNKPDYVNYLLNVIRTEWDREMFLKNEKVKEVFKNTEEAIKEAANAKNTQEMINNILLPKIWTPLKSLIDIQNDNKPQNDNTSQNSKGNNNDNFKAISNIKEIIEKVASENNIKKDINEKQCPIKNKIKNSDDEDRKKARPTIVNSYSNVKKEKYEDLYTAISPFIHYFAKKLNSIMTDNQLKRKGGTFRNGDLNNKKLYKWKCKSSRIFAQDIFRLHRAYSVSLLIDESSSMGGENIKNAALSAVLVAEVLDLVGIRFEVVGFNESVRMYKKVNESFDWSKKRNMENIIPSSNSSYSGYTNDAFTINRTVQRLKYREGEKIILILTDGSTNPSYGDIPKKERIGLPSCKHKFDALNLKEEVHLAQNKNTLIGIGINTDYVRNVYPQWTNIENVSELPRLVLNQIKRNIHRG